MSSCPACGNRDHLCQQCKMDELEDRLGLPEDHFDADAGIVCWVQDLSDDWHASMYFEGSTHVSACGEIFETPVADVRDDPRRLSSTTTCNDCEAALEEDEEEVVADGGFEKASELATDGGLKEVFRRETIVATDDGMAIGEDAVPEDDREVRPDGGNASSGIELSDSGVAAAGGLVCQNFDVHDEEVKMVSGPYDGVQCPECGRMAGGGPPLDIPYVDEPGTPAAQSNTETKRDGGAR